MPPPMIRQLERIEMFRATTTRSNPKVNSGAEHMHSPRVDYSGNSGRSNRGRRELRSQILHERSILAIQLGPDRPAGGRNFGGLSVSDR